MTMQRTLKHLSREEGAHFRYSMVYTDIHSSSDNPSETLFVGPIQSRIHDDGQESSWEGNVPRHSYEEGQEFDDEEGSTLCRCLAVLIHVGDPETDLGSKI
jgi:hypothetical protein